MNRKTSKSRRDSKLFTRLGSSLTYPQRLQLAFSVLDSEHQNQLDFQKSSPNATKEQLKALLSVGVKLEERRFAFMDFFVKNANEIIDYKRFVEIVTSEVQARMLSHDAEWYFVKEFESISGSSGTDGRISTTDARSFFQGLAKIDAHVYGSKQTFWMGAFASFLLQELTKHSGSKLAYIEFVSICRRGVDVAVAEARASVETAHEKPKSPSSTKRTRRGSVTVSSMPTEHQTPSTDSFAAWDVSRLAQKRGITRDRGISWASRGTLDSNDDSGDGVASVGADSEDDFGNPPESSDGSGSLDVGEIEHGEVPLTMIKGLMPLISSGDIEEREVKPFDSLQLDKIADLQRDLAELLIKYTRDDEDDGGSIETSSSSSSSSSEIKGPLQELLISLRTVGIRATDLPEAYQQGREPSGYEVALIEELMTSQLLNRKLKQKLQVVQHDPNYFHTVRYPAISEIPASLEINSKYITQTALRRRMVGHLGMEDELFSEGHEIIRKMRKLQNQRSHGDDLLGGLLSDRHAVIADTEEFRGALKSFTGDGTHTGGDETIEALKASMEEKSQEMRQLRDENKVLRIRLEEVESDRGDFDQLSLNVQMLRETLRNKNKAVDDLQQDNHDVRKQLDEVIHEFRRHQIAASFPDQQAASEFNFHTTHDKSAEAKERPSHVTPELQAAFENLRHESGNEDVSDATTIASQRQQQVQPTPSHYLVDLTVQIDELKHKLQMAEEARETSERRLDETNDRLHRTLEDLARQRDVHQADEDELGRLKHLVEYLEESLSNLGDKNDELATQAQRMGNLVHQKQELESKCERLVRENETINKLRQENLAHEKSLRQKELLIDTLQRDIQRGNTRDAALEQMRTQVRELTADNQKKRIELSRRVMVEKNYEQLRKRTANLQQRVDDMNSSMAVGELTKLRIERDRFRGEAAALESEVTAQDGEMKSLQSKLGEANAHVESGQMAHADLRSTQEELQMKREECEELKKALHENMQDGGELEILRNEVMDLEDKLRRAAVSAKVSSNQLTDSHLELAKVKESIKLQQGDETKSASVQKT